MDDNKIIDWDIIVDKKTGLESMRTVRKRFLTVRLWHVFLLLGIIFAATWAGVIAAIFWAIELVR